MRLIDFVKLLPEGSTVQIQVQDEIFPLSIWKLADYGRATVKMVRAVAGGSVVLVLNAGVPDILECTCVPKAFRGRGE